MKGLALMLLVLGGAAAWPYERWMEDNWDALRSRTLLELTLPGSHNVGNAAGVLGQQGAPGCASDDKYAAYQAQGGALPQTDFDRLFLPWQVLR